MLLAGLAHADAFPTGADAARTELRRMVADADGHRAELEATLLAPRPFGPDAYRKLFLAMWAQVPNWKSGDPLWIKRAEPPPPPVVKGQPRPRRPPPHEPTTVDWFEALLALDLGELEQPFAFEGLPKVTLEPVPAADREALRADALGVIATIRALAATRRAEAVAPLFQLAFTSDGVFRDECGRQLRAIGDAAVPGLVRRQYAAGSPGKQRRYALYQLDRMDRARPRKAIEAAPDDRIRAELLHAYGEVRALDAVEPVLEQIGAQGHRVRREARWAFRRYVEGPAPAPAPRRKRRLPGGKAEAEERPDYLTYREVAELALGKRAAELGIAAPEPHTALQLFEGLVARDDAERAAEWERAFLTAREHADAGDVAGAVGEYEWVLAHDPTTSRRAEMAPAFARLAELRGDAGRNDEAAGLYRKASALAADGAEASRYAAAAEYLDAQRALGRGRLDEQAYRRVIALDPGHERARDALRRVQHERLRRLARGAARAAALFVLALALGWWLALRRPTAR